MSEAKPQSANVDKAGAERVISALMHRGFLMRFILAFGQALVCGYWIGPWWAIGWLCAVSANEFVFTPMLNKAHLRELSRAARAKLGVITVAYTLFATSVHHVLWFATWIVAGRDFSYIAGICLCGALIHAQTYLSGSRWVHAASVLPPVAMGLVGPFVVPHDNQVTWIITLATAQILVVFYMAQDHYSSAASFMREMQRKWRAAENANAAKSLFLATMSHELRTPLNAVIGYAEILEETLDADGRASDAKDALRIQRAARTLLGLINDVLDLSKVEAGKMELRIAQASLRQIVSDVVQTTSHIAAENGNAVHVDLTFDDDIALTDGAKLRQCLLNLVSNACKFTDRGRIKIAGRRAGEDIVFEVADTGIGIAPEDVDRLFAPFTQADSSLTRQRGGTGLGLAITRKLAQLMGGDVSVTSAVGRGSVFRLAIKVGSAADDPRAEPAPVSVAA